MTTPLTISSSSAKRFLACQRQWYYRYILKIPDPPKGNQKLGTDVHSVLEKHLADPTYRTDWSAGNPERIARSGIPYLPAPGVGVVEHPIKRPLELSGRTLIGFVDWHLKTPNTLDILDHKTCRTFDYAHTSESLANDLQMLTYAGALADKDTQNITLKHVYYRTSGVPMALPIETTITPKAATDALNTIDRIGVEQNRVALLESPGYTSVDRRTCGAYGGCAYANVCDASPIGMRKNRLDTAKSNTFTPTKGSAEMNLAEMRRLAANRNAVATPAATPVATPVAQGIAPADQARPNVAANGVSRIDTGASYLVSAATLGRLGPINVVRVLAQIGVTDDASISECVAKSGLIWEGDALCDREHMSGRPQYAHPASWLALANVATRQVAADTGAPAPEIVEDTGTDLNDAIVSAIVTLANQRGGTVDEVAAKGAGKIAAMGAGVTKFHQSRYEKAIAHGELTGALARGPDGSLRALRGATVSAPVATTATSTAPHAAAPVSVSVSAPAPVAARPGPKAGGAPLIEVGIYVDCVDTSALLPNLSTVLEPFIEAVKHENNVTNIGLIEFGKGPAMVAGKLAAALSRAGLAMFTETRYVFSRNHPCFNEVYGELARHTGVYFVVPSVTL